MGRVTFGLFMASSHRAKAAGGKRTAAAGGGPRRADLAPEEHNAVAEVGRALARGEEKRGQGALRDQRILFALGGKAEPPRNADNIHSLY